MQIAAGEDLHLALLPIAFCTSGQGPIGLQKAGLGSARLFSGLLRIARYVVAGRALAGSFGGEYLKLDAQPWAWRSVRGMGQAKEHPEKMMVN